MWQRSQVVSSFSQGLTVDSTVSINQCICYFAFCQEISFLEYIRKHFPLLFPAILETYLCIYHLCINLLPSSFLLPSKYSSLPLSLSFSLPSSIFPVYLSMCLSSVYQLSNLSVYLPTRISSVCLLSIEEHIHSAFSLLGVHLRCLFCITSQRFPVSSSHN